MSMREILNLREQRQMKWDACKAFLNANTAADGTMSAEDSATYDRMVNAVDELGKTITRKENEQRIEDEMNAVSGSPVRVKPVEAAEQKSGRASDEYTRTFWNVMKGKVSPYSVRDALEEGVDSEGGYLVPDEYEKTLVMGLEEKNFMRSISHVIRTSSGDRKIPIVTSHGVATWTDEEVAYTESDEVFGMATLSAYKLGTLIKVSEELLKDSVFNLPAYIANEFARRIATAEEEAFLTGNGTGKPTGVFTSANAGVTAASQTAITADEIIDLYHSLKAPYRAKACFIMNDSTVKLIRKLKTANGDYLWQPSLQAGQPDRLLNVPIYTSAFAPTAAAANKAILFGDMSYYWIADRENRSFKRLNELYAENGQVGFIAHQRVDGKLILAEAVSALAMKA